MPRDGEPFAEKMKRLTTSLPAQADAILDLAVILPSEVLAEAFDKTAKPLLGRTLGYGRETCTLAALRDARLLTLISGELRVKGAEQIVETV